VVQVHPGPPFQSPANTGLFSLFPFPANSARNSSIDSVARRCASRCSEPSQDAAVAISAQASAPAISKGTIRSANSEIIHAVELDDQEERCAPLVPQGLASAFRSSSDPHMGSFGRVKKLTPGSSEENPNRFARAKKQSVYLDFSPLPASRKLRINATVSAGRSSINQCPDPATTAS
jgi:hypothetical protein